MNRNIEIINLTAHYTADWPGKDADVDCVLIKTSQLSYENHVVLTLIN